jgi:hypothetical protein
METMIITEEERLFLLKWVTQNEYKFVPNNFGPSRKVYFFDSDIETPDLVYEIRDKIIEKENITKWYPEPLLGNYVGWISDGGFIHRHIDPNQECGNHIRYNLFISIPNEGGYPIYDNQVIPVKERQYIRCNSGLYFHESQKVIGDKPRIVISYGFILPK